MKHRRANRCNYSLAHFTYPDLVAHCFFFPSFHRKSGKEKKKQRGRNAVQEKFLVLRQTRAERTSEPACRSEPPETRLVEGGMMHESAPPPSHIAEKPANVAQSRGKKQEILEPSLDKGCLFQ